MVKMSFDEIIHIREMQEEDISEITDLDKKISGFNRPEMWRSEILHYLKNNSICLVAEIQGKVVGFMIGTVHPWLFGIEMGVGSKSWEWIPHIQQRGWEKNSEKSYLKNLNHKKSRLFIHLLSGLLVIY